MKDYFDPRIPEDLEVLTALVKINPIIKLEMMTNDGRQQDWHPRGYNYLDGKSIFFSPKLFYRVKGSANENTDATET